jgi:hypothetical protein
MIQSCKKFLPVLSMFGVGMLIYFVVNSTKENFINPTNPTNPTNMNPTVSKCGFPGMMNAHGSEPAGFNALPGAVQEEQNENSPHVNPMYRKGNPQNVFPDYKLQP